MKPKAACKIAVDLAMTVILLLQMSFMLMEQETHEWLGAYLFLLFISHIVWNYKWYKNLFKGTYTLFRSILTAVNLLALACMIGLMVSGIMMSHHVFAFLEISKGMSFARELHMFAAYWGFVLMSVHLGLHWNMAMSTMRKAAQISTSSLLRTAVLRATATLIAAYGVYALTKHQIPAYLFRQSFFAFFDYSQPAALLIAEYVSVMGFCVFIAHYGAKLLQNFVLKN